MLREMRFALAMLATIQVMSVFLPHPVGALMNQQTLTSFYSRSAPSSRLELHPRKTWSPASCVSDHEPCSFENEPRLSSTSMCHYDVFEHTRAMNLRGGSDKKTSQKEEPKKGGMGEASLERLLGKQFTMDMKEGSNKQVLVKLIQQHRKGGGEFNAVTLDGKEFGIPGTKGATGNEDAEDEFKELGKGESSKKQNVKKSAQLEGLKNMVSVQTNYKGLEYTEAELAKLPKAEAEYRRELMARSKEEMKMEMGFEGAMKMGIDVAKDVYERFKKEEGAEADWTKKLPAKGVLQFRFKERALPTAAAAKSIHRPAKPAKQAEWAKGRAEALKRNQIQQEKKGPEKFTDRLNRWISIQFLLKTAVKVAMSLVSTLFNILLSIKDAIFASRSSEADVRNARAKAMS